MTNGGDDETGREGRDFRDGLDRGRRDGGGEASEGAELEESMSTSREQVEGKLVIMRRARKRKGQQGGLKRKGAKKRRLCERSDPPPPSHRPAQPRRELRGGYVRSLREP